MATEKYVVVASILAAMLTVAVSQSSCPSKVVGLSSCMTYITKNSSTPSSSCCQSLDNLVQSQPECLCPALRSGVGFSLSLALNRTLALALPAACNIRTPVSQCNEVASGPAAAPEAVIPELPESPPPVTLTAPAALIPSGSKMVPESNGKTSIVTLPIYLKLAVVFTAALMARPCTR